MKTPILGLLLAALVTTTGTHARQSSTDGQLYDEIARADRVMFDAFNGRDLGGVMASFSEDLEFYHDKDGRLTLSEVKAGLDRMFKSPEAPQRELVPGTMRVYPIPNYGAMEVGSHRFCHVENGKDVCGVFDFSHIWQKQGNRWRVTRVLSYGH